MNSLPEKLIKAWFYLCFFPQNTYSGWDTINGSLGKLVSPQKHAWEVTPAPPPWAAQPRCGLVKPPVPPLQSSKSHADARDSRWSSIMFGSLSSVVAMAWAWSTLVQCFHARCNRANSCSAVGAACGSSHLGSTRKMIFQQVDEHIDYYHLQTPIHTRRNRGTHRPGIRGDQGPCKDISSRNSQHIKTITVAW